MKRVLLKGLACGIAGVFLVLSCRSASADEVKAVPLQLLATRTLIKADLSKVAEVAEADKAAAQQLEGKGPMILGIDLGTKLNVLGLGSFPEVDGLQSFSNLSLQVFPDANRASGIYSYFPAAYYLNWDADNGYHLAIDYKYEQGGGNDVVLDARLSPGSLHADKSFLQSLLKLYLKKQPNLQHDLARTQLLEVPASYNVVFDWEAHGGESVTVSGLDRVTREIALTVTTDVGTRQHLINKLGSALGLRGDIFIQPEAVTAEQPALPMQPAQARLMLTDRAYAVTPWQRFQETEYSEFRNHHPFPVRLKYLCYLAADSNQLRLRGYDLGGSRLNPGDIAKIPNAKITEQIDDPEDVLKAVYIYALDNEEAYRQKVIDEMTGGVGALPVQNVPIDVLNSAELFQQYNIYKLVVLVESKYFDPQSDNVLSQTYEFKSGDGALDMAPLYVPTGTPGPVFQYKLGVVTTAGEQFLDSDWRSPGIFGDISIGSVQVEELLGQ